MKSPWIEGLRSVALTVPDLAAAEDFYTRTWKLDVAAREDGAIWFRGSGSDHHLLALRAAPGTPTIKAVTLRARSAAALDAIAQATVAAGGTIERAVADASDPAGGRCLVIRDHDGRRFEIVHGDARRTPDAPPPPDQPVRLAHAVLNCHAIATTQAFLESCLLYTSPSPRDRTRSRMPSSA